MYCTGFQRGAENDRVGTAPKGIDCSECDEKTTDSISKLVSHRSINTIRWTIVHVFSDVATSRVSLQFW